MPLSAELRSQIEGLALRAVVANRLSAPEWLPELARVQTAAEAEQALPVAAAAAQLSARIRARSFDAEALQEGMILLQRATESAEGARPVKAPAEDPELIGDFVLESREHLASIESQALALERDPSDAEALNAAFRGFHTIKGLAGFLELRGIQELAHEVEAVL